MQCRKIVFKNKKITIKKEIEMQSDRYQLSERTKIEMFSLSENEIKHFE